MENLKKSSVPGLSYFPPRDEPISTGRRFVEGRRRMDGAENLWRIGNRLYDLEQWAKSHPGGSEWITITKGTDITELFETHHLSDKAERLLPKFFAREAKTKRNIPWTFENDSFYKKFKQRAIMALKDVNYHGPSIKTNIIADFLASMALVTALLAAKTQTWISILIAAVLMTWTSVSGHNYLHMRDNFRMYYFEISLMSTKEWRITHVLSHHMYPNTLWDFELYAFEPLLQWLPGSAKPIVPNFFAALYSPLIWTSVLFTQGFKRYYSVIVNRVQGDYRDFIPFIIPSAMYLVNWSLMETIVTWVLILAASSTMFYFIGLNAAHHHPDIFHDGDIHRENLDWGLFEMDAVRGRRVIDDSLFLVMTNFGSHTLHHLLPTVDHAYLPLCQGAFEETCKEFGINLDRLTQWELVKGQFKQLYRTQPKDFR